MSDSTGHNPRLADFTPAQLLGELQSRPGVIAAMVTTSQAENVVRSSTEGQDLDAEQVVRAAGMLMQDAKETLQNDLAATAVSKLDNYWENNSEDIIEDAVKPVVLMTPEQPLRPAFPRPLAP